MVRATGCLPDPPGVYMPSKNLVGSPVSDLPEEHLGVRPYCPQFVEDQGTTEACVGHAIGNALYIRQKVEGRLAVMPSKAAIWYFARSMMGSEAENVGVAPSNAFVAIDMHGYPPAWSWPLTERFDKRPDEEAMRYAVDQEGVLCGRLSDDHPLARVDDLKMALVSQFPVTIALHIDGNYQSNRDGYWRRGGPDRGWHYVVAVSYNAEGVWTLGSYGVEHGLAGFVHVPWDDVKHASRDAWAVRLAPQPMAAAA